MLQGKRKASTNWLPSQVAYGVDVSDPDPEKQRAFGALAEQAAEAVKHAPKRPAEDK